MAGLKLKGTTWHLRMRVPVRYASVVPKGHKEITRSLKTDSKKKAEEDLPKMKEAILAELDAKLVGEAAEDATDRFIRSVALAKVRGHPYQTAEELAEGPAEVVVSRLLKSAKEDPKAKNKELIAADLGGVKRPKILVSDLLKEYEKIKRAVNSSKTDDQMRRWRNPLKMALKLITSEIGDKPALDVTRQDALLVFDGMVERVAEGEILADTANKSLASIRSMFRAHFDRNQIDARMVFENLTAKGGRKSKKRPEFSREWVRENLLCENPLPGTNDEIRDVLIIMASTGASPSEITGTMPKHFALDDNIPHIQLREEGRRLKNEYRVRDLVLVGPALEAARRHRKGFLRYRGKPGFSDAANAFLGENGMLPSTDHTIYSLRHSFQGLLRWTQPGLDQFVQARMMGHSAKNALGREAYGDDLTLGQRLKVMQQIRID